MAALIFLMLEPAAQTVGVVGLVRQQALRLSDGGEKREQLRPQCRRRFRRRRASDRPAAIVGQSTESARSSAGAKAADRFLQTPPF